jgi:hypothetical protein
MRYYAALYYDRGLMWTYWLKSVEQLRSEILGDRILKII